MKISSFKDLIVWQKSIDLVGEIYKITRNFPKEEVFSVVSQMRRAAISIPSNISEGWSRKTTKDYLHFLRMAYGSTSELDTQLIISKNLLLINEVEYNNISDLLSEVAKMLNSTLRKLAPER